MVRAVRGTVRIMLPLYQKIAEDIRAQLRAGILKPGDKIPSTRELCEQYEVSVTVVRMAIVVLKTEGVIVGVPGKGVYVA